MAQAATLNDAQIKRALRFCQTRKHTVRDCTILLFSLYTGLRAKELAALSIGGVSETLCMSVSPCGFDGSFVEPFWI